MPSYCGRQCEVPGPRNKDDYSYSLLRYNAGQTGTQLPTFQRRLLPLSAYYHDRKLKINCVKTNRDFKLITFCYNLVPTFHLTITFDLLNVILYMFNTRCFELQKFYATDGFQFNPGSAEDWVTLYLVNIFYINLSIHHGKDVCSSLYQYPTSQSFLWHTFMSLNFNCVVLFEPD
jgi:hypothetical protein